MVTCNKCILTEQQLPWVVQYKGHSATITYTVMSCEVCNQRTCTPEQIISNGKKSMDFYLNAAEQTK